MMEEKLLEQTLKMRNPVLFLGAGFSRGSLVGKKELPVGETLRKNIFDEFYKKEHLKKLKILEEDYAEIEKYELAELCGNINAESDERKKELIKFLVDTFKGAQVKKSDPFHKLLIEYNWKCIYTLNIDDLVENIYEASDKILCVQNEKIRKCFCEGTTQLVKIHGCVRKPELGFVFGKDEYQDSIQQENFKLRMFAQDFFDSDVIFVGTEFNEEDILYLINKYKKSGSRSNGSNYYFIAPKIKNKLKNLIKNNENFYFIPWTAKEFLVKCAKISNDTDMIFEKEKILKQYHFQK